MILFVSATIAGSESRVHALEMMEERERLYTPGAQKRCESAESRLATRASYQSGTVVVGHRSSIGFLFSLLSLSLLLLFLCAPC